MRKLDREIIDIAEGAPLHALNERLHAVQCNLPADSEARVTVQGDDNFGWRLVVSYFRDLTTDEVELERKYAAGFDHGHGAFLAAPSLSAGAELRSL